MPMTLHGTFALKEVVKLIVAYRRYLGCEESRCNCVARYVVPCLLGTQLTGKIAHSTLGGGVLGYAHAEGKIHANGAEH